MNFLDDNEVTRGLMRFLDASPTALFAAKNLGGELDRNGYTRLYEGEAWNLREGQGYYVCRNESALIAFRVPGRDFRGFQILAGHLDSPLFRIKTNAEIGVDAKYVKLNTEGYGGMLMAPWLDRPLSVAGRVVVRTENGVESRLVNIDRDLLIIPNVAIHMNREANSGMKFNAQTDLLPLLGTLPAAEKKMEPPLRRCGAGMGVEDTSDTSAAGAPERMEEGRDSEEGRKKARAVSSAFLALIAEAAGVKPEDILDSDLYVYNRMKATVLGLHQEFVCSGRLDDLQCAWATFQGFLASTPGESAAVYCAFDNEEVGSSTKQGANSDFLRNVLTRVCSAFGFSEEERMQKMTNSFMISADNAHSIHPNHPELADPTNRPVINGGIVIKYSANQKYTTDAVSGAIMRAVCEKAGVPFQTFHNRSDMAGGSTLGNISTTQLAVNTVDIGLPQLAMHSPYETAGVKDTGYLIRAAKTFCSGSVLSRGDGSFALHF
ncbi:MAG: M18 family aminopeptidase [Lachnospiraceae bacterium]|nr:M18 family aminopeptidase [Lachnospiraceae bacterium]